MRSIQIHLSQIQQRACFGHQNQLTNFDPLNINAGKQLNPTMVQNARHNLVLQI